MPKPRRLAEWYCKMLDLALEAGVIRDFRELLTDAHDSHLQSVAELPYFEGDFWPNAIEDLLAQMAAKQQRRLVDVSSAEITRRLYELFERHNGVFFVVRLAPTPLPETLDPDPLVHCELVELRDNLICLAREKHFEFSSYRRTKFSSIMILYELHNQRDEYTCNACSTSIDARYHCATCDDFDLCAACYEEDARSEKPHPHPLEQVGFELVTPQKQLKAEALVASTSSVHIVQTAVSSTSTTSSATATGGTHGMTTVAGQRSALAQEKLAALVHACTCRDEKTCGVQLCTAMKRVLDHFRECNRRLAPGCSICKQLTAMLADHSRRCSISANPTTRGTCPVPLCVDLRQRSLEQDRYRRATEQNYQMRRMAAMNWSSSGAASASAVVTVPPATSLFVSASAAVAASDQLRVPSASTLSLAVRIDAYAPTAASISPVIGHLSAQSAVNSMAVPSHLPAAPLQPLPASGNRSPAIGLASSVSASSPNPIVATTPQVQSFVVTQPMSFTQFMRSRPPTVSPYRQSAVAVSANADMRFNRLIRPLPPRFTQSRPAATSPQQPSPQHLATTSALRTVIISRTSNPQKQQVCCSAHFKNITSTVLLRVISNNGAIVINLGLF